MGHRVEEIARRRGHEICCTIDAGEETKFASHEFREADAAIEFSRPETAVGNILAAFAANVPIVCGTTGWYDSLPELEAICRRGEGTLLYSSNFSIGVTVFRAVNRYLAGIMARFSQYDPKMEETHHIHKLDHPSGTAITLAEELSAANGRIVGWEEVMTYGEQPHKEKLGIFCRREGEIPGIHTICWDSDVDSITLTHSAKSRDGFALGAVLGAEWLKGKKGVFTMADFLPL